MIFVFFGIMFLLLALVFINAVLVAAAAFMRLVTTMHADFQA